MSENKCVCGGETHHYDGALGYEAMVCQTCGLHYNSYSKEDHEIQLKKYKELHEKLIKNSTKRMEDRPFFSIQFYNKEYNFWNEFARFDGRWQANEYLNFMHKSHPTSIYAIYEYKKNAPADLIKMVGLDQLT